MIRYTLRCDRGHTFESWFKDSQAFDALSDGGHLACPSCGSSEVGKALMAPAVRTSRMRTPAPAEAVPAQVIAPAEEANPPSTEAERMAQLRGLMREMHKRMVDHSTDVGPAFADEARKMHEGVSDEKAIRGTASKDDVRALLEDGIDILPMPTLPDEHH